MQLCQFLYDKERTTTGKGEGLMKCEACKGKGLVLHIQTEPIQLEPASFFEARAMLEHSFLKVCSDCNGKGMRD